MQPPGNNPGGSGGGWKKATPQKQQNPSSGPPPLPSQGQLQNASNQAQNTQGSPGVGVKPCTWKLSVNIHSTERFWPKDSFEVQFGAIKPPTIGVNQPLTPPINPWYKSSLKMAKKDAPPVLFSDCGPKDGGVTALVCNLKKEAD